MARREPGSKGDERRRPRRSRTRAQIVDREHPNSPRVDLNKASVEELTAIDRVNRERARSMVNYRSEHGPFRSWADVEKVPGIGRGMLRRIRSAATLGDATGGESYAPV